ncbi:MAG: SCO family protein [Myxococcota bacterium]|nr:SCO family protein [Myxococcota bacterium]
MRTRSLAPVLLLVLLALPWALACGGDGHPPGVHEGRGVVEAVLAEDGQLVVAHEDIEGLMPAMTMSFDVADPALLEAVRPGQTIVFHLEAEEGRYRILDLRVVGAAGEAGAAGASGGSFTPADAAEPAPPFALTDLSGETLALEDLRGKTVLLDFIYTNCPGPCPILTSTHVRVQRTLDEALRDRVHFVSISIDPERDTRAALRAYAEARGVDLSDWSFLTGDPEEVDAVLRAYGVGRTPGEGGEIVHVVATYLIDAEGRIADRYVGLEHHADDLREDVERVARGAAGAS